MTPFRATSHRDSGQEYLLGDVRSMSQQRKWGDLTLSDGVLIVDGRAVNLRRGFDITMQRESNCNMRYCHVLTINESSERVLPLFVDLLQRFRRWVDVFAHVELSTRHWTEDFERRDAGLHELVTLMSQLHDFEDVLVHDSDMAIEIVLIRPFARLCLDHDKCISFVFRSEKMLYPLIRLLTRRGIPRWAHLLRVRDLKHACVSSSQLTYRFRELCMQFGCDSDI